jgi:hypothetical protein
MMRREDMSKHYVVTIYSDREPGDVQIVGPFEDGEEAAGEWGREWQEANDDNPCWQTVTLPDNFKPEIVAPGKTWPKEAKANEQPS